MKEALKTVMPELLVLLKVHYRTVVTFSISQSAVTIIVHTYVNTCTCTWLHWCSVCVLLMLCCSPCTCLFESDCILIYLTCTCAF